MFGSPNRLGSSGFVQMPAFGGFGSTPTQTNPFGSATQPSQPAFGSSIFGSDTGFYEGLRVKPWKYSVSSYPAKTEEDGGTSGQTAKLESISAMPAYKYKRFESCVAIAGADCCVIAADYTCYHHTKISQVTEKSVMASSGLQADVNALQEVLSNLIDKHQFHNKPMSCPEIDRLLSKAFYTKYLYHPFTVLAGFDREGKGCVFTHVGGTPMNESISREKIIIPPILKYKLPAEDVVTRLSETEAVNLVKTIFASTTCTGDKLEIVVLNASGLHREYMDLRKKD